MQRIVEWVIKPKTVGGWARVQSSLCHLECAEGQETSWELIAWHGFTTMLGNPVLG